MNRTTQVAMASLVLAALAFLTPSVASAAQKWDLNITPVIFWTTRATQAPRRRPHDSVPIARTGGPASPAGFRSERKTCVWTTP